jgi:excinuclease ABC subunit B
LKTDYLSCQYVCDISRCVCKAIWEIQQDLVKQVDYFKEIGKHLEAKRLEEELRFRNDSGIRILLGNRNYSRYLDGRLPGTDLFLSTRLFSKDYLMVVDESHALFSVKAMYGGDRSRGENMASGFLLRWITVR